MRSTQRTRFVVAVVLLSTIAGAVAMVYRHPDLPVLWPAGLGAAGGAIWSMVLLRVTFWALERRAPKNGQA
ncbi:MAG: hypothetical protein JJ896_02795 [Rhodothermales bacterium]|nr:hypothetical protein [Rhodothermales bacterium]MBO6778559.1 hypothetical protein [Rhodothermales bacterium]